MKGGVGGGRGKMKEGQGGGRGGSGRTGRGRGGEGHLEGRGGAESLGAAVPLRGPRGRRIRVRNRGRYQRGLNLDAAADPL